MGVKEAATQLGTDAEGRATYQLPDSLAATDNQTVAAETCALPNKAPSCPGRAVWTVRSGRPP